MQIHIVAIGDRMPAWVEAGYQEYAKRLPRECRLVLHEIPADRRAKGADLR
ncbi:MAG: 23S rRNA (pseudouridine(1915)-N(3))-methyltransferase RlmH, partial [Pseudomonadota bacterium]